MENLCTSELKLSQCSIYILCFKLMLLELHLFVLYKVGPALAHCSSEAAFVNHLFTEKEDAEFLSGHYGNLASSSLQERYPKNCIGMLLLGIGI